jgi:hypothetical protein
MSLGNGTTVSGLGTTSTFSGHTYDSGVTNTAGVVSDKNVQVDFVWGNMPGQPNDLRTVVTDTVTSTNTTDPVTGGSKRLIPNKDNHEIILGGWNGYPSYTPNDPGEFTQSSPVYSTTTGLATNTPYIVVPNVLGLNAATTATTVTIAGVSTVLSAYSAQDGLRDSGYQDANIKVNGTDRANTAISITNITRTAGSFDATITAAAGVAQYPVGTRITVSSTSTVDGTWTVKSVSSTNLVTFTTNASTVLTSGTGSVVGVSGTVFSQTVAPAANTITGSADITITKYA